MNQLDAKDRTIAMAVFGIALAIRLVFLFTSPDRGWPHSALYEGDAPTWAVWANALDQNQPFEFDLPLRSPAVAYLLSWIHPGVIESTLTPFKALWCIFTALAAALLYVAVRLAFKRRIALIAVGLYTFSFGSYAISTSLNNEALYSLILVAIVIIALKLMLRPTLAMAAILGILHGLAMLTRAEHMLLFVMMFAFLGFHLFVGKSFTLQFKRHSLASIAVIAFSAFAVCLPWSIRGSLATQRFNTVSPDTPNFEGAHPPWSSEARQIVESLPAFARDGNFRYISHLAAVAGKNQVTVDDVRSFFTDHFKHTPEPLSEYSLLSLKGPVDFALANHPDSTGGFSKAALAVPGERDPTIQFGRPDHLRLFNRGYSVGWTYITNDVVGWLRLVGSKLAIFSHGVTFGFTSRNLPLGWEGTRRPIDLFVANASPIWQTMILLLVVGGATICFVRKQGGIWLVIILYKLIVTILFYGYARQAVSILPAFFVLVALSCDQVGVWVGARLKPTRRLGVIAAIAILAFLLLVDLTGSFNRPRLAVTGPVRFTPQWGAEAFESYEAITIQPAEASQK